MATTKNGKVFTVTYERDARGWWIARIPEVAGCHTQGRTLEQARTRIREALAASVDDPAIVASAVLIDKPRLPRELSATVRAARQARAKAEDVQTEAQNILRRAARELAEAGVSMRDAAVLLGVSFQRVHQLNNKAA